MEEAVKNSELSFVKDLVRFATRPMTAQRDETARGIWWHGTRYISIPLGGGNRACYVYRPDYENGLKKVINDEFGDRDKWNQHVKDYEAFTREGSEIVKTAINCERKTLEECLAAYKKWVSLVHDFGKIILAPFAIELYLDPECRELLYKEFGDEADSAFHIICTPGKINEFQQMRLDIIASIINGQPTAKELAKKYFWYSEYSFVEPLLDEEHFDKEIKAISAAEALQEQGKIFHDTEKNQAEFQAIRSRIKNERLLLLADVIHEYVFLRTDRIDVWKKAQAQIRNVFLRIYQEIVKKDADHVWRPEMIPYFLNYEIIDFLSDGIIPAFEDLNERVKQNYIFYTCEDVPKVIYGDEAVRMKELIESTESEKDSIKGMIAFKGKVSGRVVLVHGKHDFSKVQIGDILVAKTTMPDYVSIMSKAVAFVTEEGGVTSHAAVVARELKKPCIVGTGNCMKALSDGDMVEVDADKGIVRKI